MNIFISYSVSDTATVHQIASKIQSLGSVRYWAESREPGNEAWPTIFSWIDSSDLVFVVITGAALKRAMSVGQEVGRARNQQKFIVPLVERGIPASELGCLNGLTYIELDPADLGATLEQARAVVEKRKMEKEATTNAVLAIGALVALIYAASD